MESFASSHLSAGFISSDLDMLEQAINQLVSGDFNARWGVAKSLKLMGEVAHPSLISILETNPQDPDLLGFIAEILGHSPSPQAMLALVHLLNHCDDDDVREAVIYILAKQGPTCVDALLSYLDHPDLQRSVLKALIQMNHPATIEGFLLGCKKDDPEMRALAFEGLGQFHHGAIAPRLIQGLQDPDANVRGICVKALGLRSKSDVNEVLISAVSPLLYDTNERVGRLAAKTLGRFNHPLALESLWHRLIEPSHPSAITPDLIQALAWSGHSQGVHFLLKTMTLLVCDDGPAFRQSWPSELVIELIQTLANLHESNHFSAVENAFMLLLSSKSPLFESIQMKQVLTMAIAKLGQDRSIPPLIQVLANDNDRLRFHVIAALKQLNRDLSYKQLLESSQDLTLEPELRTGIAIALKEW